MRESLSEINHNEASLPPRNKKRSRGRKVRFHGGVGTYNPDLFFPPSRPERRKRAIHMLGKVVTYITLLTVGGMTVDGMVVEHNLANTEASIIDVTLDASQVKDAGDLIKNIPDLEAQADLTANIPQANSHPNTDITIDIPHDTSDGKKPEMSPYFDPHMATVVMLGFGGLDATSVGEELSPWLSQLGHVWAMRYDDKGIDPKELADVIGKKARAEGITKISFHNISVAGAFGTTVALALLDGDYGITSIPEYIFDSSPDSPDNLKSDYAQQGQIQAALHEFASTQADGMSTRDLVELWIRRDRWSPLPPRRFNKGMSVPAAAVKTNTEIIHDIWSPESASNSLLNSAYNEFAKTNVKQNLAQIAAYEKAKHMPLTDTTYIGAAGKGDYIVNIPKSSMAVEEDIHDAGLPDTREIIEPGIVHGSPTATPKIYDKIYSNLVPKILNSIEWLKAHVPKRGHLAEQNASADNLTTAQPSVAPTDSEQNK